MIVCCENCFNYEPFKKHIQEKGIINNCSFCTSQGVRTLDVQDSFLMKICSFLLINLERMIQALN